MGGEKVDYYEIGQRIRRIRKARGLSQEQLAEKIGISVTHMSHIETANTKLSLPVFVELAEALAVKTDFLLYDAPQSTVSESQAAVAAILESCSTKQAQIIADVVKTLKQSLEINGRK